MEEIADWPKSRASGKHLTFAAVSGARKMRNAMTVIGGFSSLALRKDDHALYLKTIKASALHPGCLLNDAELLSKLEKDDGKLSIETVAINLPAADARAARHGVTDYICKGDIADLRRKVRLHLGYS